MIRYILFKSAYTDKKKKCKFQPNVKYRLKDENSKNYITLKKVKLPKRLEHKLYDVFKTLS